MSDDGHDELGAALGRAGFELAGAMPAIAGRVPEAKPEPSPDLVLASPADDGDWEAVAAVQRAGFALPAATSATIVRSVRALGEAETGPPTIEVVLARRAGVQGCLTVTQIDVPTLAQTIFGAQRIEAPLNV